MLARLAVHWDRWWLNTGRHIADRWFERLLDLVWYRRP